LANPTTDITQTRCLKVNDMHYRRARVAVLAWERRKHSCEVPPRLWHRAESLAYSETLSSHYYEVTSVGLHYLTGLDVWYLTSPDNWQAESNLSYSRRLQDISPL